MDFMTPLFLKDFTKAIASLNIIIKRLPNFISTYVNFCLNSNLDICYNDDKSKNDFYFKLCNLIQLFLDNKFTTVEYIIELLDNVNYLNLDFSATIIKSIPQINEESPQTVEKFNKFHTLIQNLTNDQTLSREVAWPTVVIGDANNPRISKFGGCQPFLPEEGFTLCKGCHSKCSMVCQIYVPTTPKWFQERFPLEYRDSMIAVLYCNHCYLQVEAKFYTKDQLDSIVYTDDVVFPGVVNYTFNDPRIVTGWTSGRMMPNMSNMIVNEIAEKNSVDSEELDEQFQKYNFVHEPPGENGTYIGGWPDFVQDDCTPEDSFLVINLSESCSSTAMWGDAGAAQVFMKNPVNDSFGELEAHWACC